MILLDAGPSSRGFHRLEAYLRCPRLYAWGYGQGGSNPERASAFPPAFPLVRGSIGHVGLAHVYARLKWVGEGNDLASSPHYPPLEAMKLVADRFGDLGQEALPGIVAVVQRYAAHYGAEPFKIVSVEDAVETSFEGYRYTARLDLVIEDRAGKVWIMDHKFVGRIDSKVHRRYVLSGQFLGFQWIGFKLYGERFGGVRLNLIGCNASQFQRLTPEPAPWMLERYPAIVRHAEEGIARVEEMIRKGETVPASPSEHTCMGSYGECPAFELCRWGEEIPLPPSAIEEEKDVSGA